MNKRDLARFKKLIEKERQIVYEKLGVIENEISDRAASQSGGGHAYSNHMADIGSDAMEQEQAFLHASKGNDYLAELNDALRRIEKGTYGQCDECGNKIPIKRLQAYLPARLCIECKSRLEKLHRN